MEDTINPVVKAVPANIHGTHAMYRYSNFIIATLAIYAFMATPGKWEMLAFTVF
jgi:hypothetical protein